MREEIINVPNATESDPFRILMTGTSYCDGSYHIRRPESPLLCMEYVISGRGTVITRGQTFYPEEGDIYLLHQGDDHDYYADPSDPWVKIWFNVSGPLVTALLRAYGLEQTNLIRGLNLRPLFEQFVDNARKKPEEANVSNALLFHQIVQQAAAHLNPVESGDAARLRAYLDAHADEQIAVETLAKLIYRSPSQTIRIFKKAYGQTPYQYALDRRIETAKLMLEGTGLSVKEIARRLCFADEHYFSNIFKLKTGVSPRAYRGTPEKDAENIPVYML